VPWCEGCSRFLNPNTLEADGTCPTCGRQVAEPSSLPAAAAAQRSKSKAPWHFKLLVLVTVVYVGFRVIQMTTWLVEWLASR
jgi:hypothetical protein